MTIQKIEKLQVSISTPSQELNEQFIAKINEIIDSLPQEKEITHEELFSHRNKLCECFKPQEEKGEDWQSTKKPWTLGEIMRHIGISQQNQDWIHKEVKRYFDGLLSTTAEKARQEERERIILLIEKFGKEPITRSIGTYEEGYQDCFNEFKSAITKN